MSVAERESATFDLLFLANAGIAKCVDTFYFRKYIPDDLIEHFDGVKEFRISLKSAIKSLKSSLREAEWSGLIKPVGVM